MGVSHGHNLGCACRNGPCAYGRGVFHHQQHSNRASAQRFGTEIEVLWGFFGNPELSAAHRQLSDTAAVHSVQFARAKRRFVEVDRLRPAGVSFRNDIISGPGGRQIIVDDPDGNPVELFEARR